MRYRARLLALLVVSALGALLSGGLLALTSLAPSFVERRAESYLSHRLVRDLAARFGLQPEAARELVEALPARAKQVMVVRTEALVRRDGGDDEVTGAAQRSYGLVLNQLLTELRIFGAAQCCTFLLATLLLLIGSRSEKAGRLTDLGGIIAIATTIGGVVFLFARDWTWSVVTGDSLGSVYLLTVVLFAAATLDIGFNDARLMSVVARVVWWWPP